MLFQTVTFTSRIVFGNIRGFTLYLLEIWNYIFYFLLFSHLSVMLSNVKRLLKHLLLISWLQRTMILTTFPTSPKLPDTKRIDVIYNFIIYYLYPYKRSWVSTDIYLLLKCPCIKKTSCKSRICWFSLGRVWRSIPPHRRGCRGPPGTPGSRCRRGRRGGASRWWGWCRGTWSRCTACTPPSSLSIRQLQPLKCQAQLCKGHG